MRVTNTVIVPNLPECVSVGTAEDAIDADLDHRSVVTVTRAAVPGGVSLDTFGHCDYVR
jgi:hypothetical protein